MFEEQSDRILKPVKPSFIFWSLAFAFVFNLLPWRDLRGVPDLVALVLCFWSIYQPRLISIGIPFLAGLLMDAANGVLLGQHALGYSVLAFVAQTLSRRILWFRPTGQALHVLVLLLGVQAISFGVRMATGGTFPGWTYFSGSVIAALLWPIATFLLLAPQRAAEGNENERF